MPHEPKPRPPLPQSFIIKKSHILTSLSLPSESYTDKSPKGTVDAPIVQLIDEINAIDGLVTTSSCSGRVAVFVEGGRAELGEGVNGMDGADGDGGGKGESDSEGNAEVKAMVGGPGGKGGGKWLFVSHERVVKPSGRDGGWLGLCGLKAEPADTRDEKSTVMRTRTSPPRLVKLIFSPLILHVLVARLQDARHLLAAAINAGFRESGVQSLKALEDPDAGVMVGIRTAGLGFETVVGVVREVDGEEEVYEAVVGEEYLDVVFSVVDERFVWNERRRERLRAEVARVERVMVSERARGEGWEGKEERARRKREEGLRRKREKERMELWRGEEEYLRGDVFAAKGFPTFHPDSGT